MLLRFIVVFFTCLSFSSLSWANVAETSSYPPLQPLVDKLKRGDVFIIPPGTYSGPVFIEQAITLDGQGKVTINSGGKGSVIILDTDGAVIKNLHLTNSGDHHNDLDSGVQVRGNFNVIKDNIIDDCLFGIDLQQSENNIVKRNHISSKDEELGMRGDAIRLWYSFDNKIIGNTIRDTRDMVVWYSKNNTIKDNTTVGGRYGLHFMYSQYNLVENNSYKNNSVGIFLMYSDGVKVLNNTISHATGAAGVGIGFKETSDIVVNDNKILFSSIGLSIDVSPYQPDTINYFTNNLVAFNGVGIRFLANWKNNIFKNNHLKANISQIMVMGGKTANRNIWEGNYWDDYEGFDLDHDGVGDTPHDIYAYSDRIWQDVPGAQFFKGSAMLELIDFLERLAPFSEPDLILRDKSPIMDVNLDTIAIKESLDAELTPESGPEILPGFKPENELEQRLKGYLQ
ncbi:MAG: nitrous oxide reductase family maturation protein NosD [gamma proteobacterium symbiont of Lucinoma myriamae]|nr:nitrous oxide reductase family maturation protein NosD [gamma proteobacterium symbiont of Lucinoma myriamae]MCU7818412.1 nitrous oxide reductase family maturation protein NosD [gamma proteobacterium symbiont of Lucinoma myriamae]MCU7832495.1 nitrous oxide reductase family maturation protein NosD [gamma proteobacterium symbiont of Lucinoma myriamae]